MAPLYFVNRQCIILLFIPLIFFQLHLTKVESASLVNNGFQNVTVAISSAIQQSQQSSLVNGLQSLFEAASYVMFIATGKRAYFSTVIIRFPASWNDDLTAIEGASSESESYYTADIRVANPNVAYGDLPYTQQSKGCGEGGDFIHLTPEFVTYNYDVEQEYGPAENLFVHEWIKYRYGVFDENGYAFDYTYPQMYFGQNNITEYNMCNNTAVDWQYSVCHYDDSDIEGLPSNCSLKADEYSYDNVYVSTSMLSRVTLPVAAAFCNDSSDHNYEAPNPHNFLCNGKGVMEVILEHEDFQDGRNSPSDIYIPNLLIYEEYQQSTNGTLMAFIVWDPMTLEQTYYTAGPALLKFVYLDFPDKSYFGIIDTVDTNTTLVPLTQVDQYNRDSIVSDIVIGLETSETPIGNVYQAVVSAIHALQSNKSLFDANTNANGIVVMSNTEEETNWDAVCSKAESNGIRLLLVTYSQYVADEFDSSNCTGLAILIDTKFTDDTIDNQTKLANDEQASDDISTCLVYLKQRADLDLAFMNLPVRISPDFGVPSLYYLGTYVNSTEDTFVVDTSHINGNHFYVETCTNIQEQSPGALLTCWLGDPDNVYPYNNKIQAFFDEDTQLKSGIWSFGITQITTRGISAPYTVYAVGSPVLDVHEDGDSTSIQIRTWVDVGSMDGEYNSTSNSSYSLPKVRLFVSVNRGTTPVFDARIQATIRNSANFDAVQVVLLDNGSGNPDITKDDGVYSSYFTQFVQNDEQIQHVVQYVVRFDIDDNDGIATYPVDRYPWLSGIKHMDVEYSEPIDVKEFARFSYTIPFEEGSGYYLPPGNIYDLRVVETQGATVTLEWTAPGADYDYGLASQYIFKCSTDRFELIEHFDDLPEAEIPLTQPTTPTYKQSVTFTGINDKATHFCALKVYDNEDRDGGILSNVVSYYIESR